MSDTGQKPLWYPPDNGRIVKALRFCNLLDDAKNVVSPVKVNLWGANLAGISTAAGALFAWISAHWGMLEHVTQLGDVVGPYLAGSHMVHHFDKRERNLQASRMKEN